MERPNRAAKKGVQSAHDSKKRERRARTVANPDAAGIDLGSKEHYVAVPTDRDRKPVRSFRTTTDALHRLADWLERCGVNTVAMESTGIYWIPLYEILQERGVDVCLVNASHLKNVPGRKTDVADCQWLQELHTYGLLRASFRPSLGVCELRSYCRQRDELVARASAEIQRMQKALILMNVRLDAVVSDISGTTGQAVIRDILSGNRDPKDLAKHRDRRCHATEPQFAAALTGSYRTEHVFALRQAVEAHDFIQRQIRECDEEAERVLNELAAQYPPPPEDTPPRRNKRRKPQRNEPGFEIQAPLFRMTSCDLSQVNGIGVHTALKIIAEIGTDMSPWKDEKHFTSWLQLAPGNNITGGKRRPSKRRRVAHRVSQHFRIAAMTLGRSGTALGAFYRRLAAKIGAAKAITATARKIAIIVYRMLRYGCSYEDAGAAEYERRYEARVIDGLRRRAKSLGYELVDVDSDAASA